MPVYPAPLRGICPPLACAAWPLLAVFAVATAGATENAKSLAPVANLGSLIDIRHLPLAQPAVNHQFLGVHVAADPRGGCWVCWHNRDGKKPSSHVQHLSGELLPDRPTIDLPDRSVQGMLGHEDGSLALALGARTGPEVKGSHAPKPPVANTLLLRKISNQGETVFETKVRGGEGYEKNNVWLLVDGTAPNVSVSFNGRFYGLFYCIGKKFSGGDTHQADEFIALDLKGEIIPQSRITWMTSHSFWMSSVAGADGNFYGLTVADPQPWGLRFANFTRTPGKAQLTMVFPPETVRKTARKIGEPVRPGPIFRMPEGFGVAAATYINPAALDKPSHGSRLPILVRFNESGQSTTYYLDDQPVSDLIVTGARFGNNHVAVMQASGRGGAANVFGAFPTKLRIVDDRGRVAHEAMDVPAPLTFGSHPATMPNGDVIWAGVADDHTSVDNANLLYVVRIRWPKAKNLAGGSRAQSATTSPQKRMNLARKLQAKGDVQRVRSVLEALVRMYPDSPEAAFATKWLEGDGTTALEEDAPPPENPAE